MLLLSNLLAAEYPNTGLAQNEYGYYGDGVVFGDYAIIGKWLLESKALVVFDEDSIAIENIKKTKYGVSEDGMKLFFGDYGRKSFKINRAGNEGCFSIEYLLSNGDFGDFGYSTTMCKINIDTKIYGTPSNSINITVNTQE